MYRDDDLDDFRYSDLKYLLFLVKPISSQKIFLRDLS